MKALTKIELAILFDIYGELLTDKQQHILNSYCNYDCSLGEIAEESEISRQGVRDAIVKACESMSRFESKLHIVAKNARQDRLSQQLLQAIQRKDLEDISVIISDFAREE